LAVTAFDDEGQVIGVAEFEYPDEADPEFKTAAFREASQMPRDAVRFILGFGFCEAQI
jgi:hypothetical protein